MDLGSDGQVLLLGGIAAAVGLAILALATTRTNADQAVEICGLLAGIGGAWLAWADKSDLDGRVQEVTGSFAAANVGAGVWLCLVGCVLLAGSMLWLLIRMREEVKPPPTPPTPA